MQINIKTSEKNQEVVRRLTAKLPDGTKENVIARIALGYSLQSGKKFHPSEFNNYDSKGKEYKDHILFDEKYRDFYIALICQHYGLNKSEETVIPKYIKLHIDHGLEMLDKFFSNNSNYTFWDFFSEYIRKGIKHLSNTTVPLGAVRNNNQTVVKSYFTGPIKLNIGSIGDAPLSMTLNDTSKRNNCHIAIAGNSGTGKTQFALELLSQIHEETHGQTNFIYLDFKGLKDNDIDSMSPFFKSTSTHFVNAPHNPFPVNPLTFIDNVNQTNQSMGIDKFVDIICKFSNLGNIQKGQLRDAVTEAFQNQKGGTYPTIKEIDECLRNIHADKPDSLTEIIGDLSRYNIFLDDADNTSDFLNKNVYLSLSGDLANSIRFTALFLIINYIYNIFMNMENSPEDNNIKALRYIILIDEAHVIFKEKKYQDILEKALREIRSKGVSIILLSQGIEEYNQAGFDFSSLCETSFLLDIKDKEQKSIERFMGLTGSMSTKIMRDMEHLLTGEAITNFGPTGKSPVRFKIKQYWHRNNE